MSAVAITWLAVVAGLAWAITVVTGVLLFGDCSGLVFRRRLAVFLMAAVVGATSCKAAFTGVATYEAPMAVEVSP